MAVYTRREFFVPVQSTRFQKAAELICLPWMGLTQFCAHFSVCKTKSMFWILMCDLSGWVKTQWPNSHRLWDDMTSIVLQVWTCHFFFLFLNLFTSLDLYYYSKEVIAKQSDRKKRIQEKYYWHNSFEMFAFVKLNYFLWYPVTVNGDQWEVNLIH